MTADLMARQSASPPACRASLSAAREHGHNNMHTNRLGSRYVYIPTPYGAWLKCMVWACRTPNSVVFAVV